MVTCRKHPVALYHDYFTPFTCNDSSINSPSGYSCDNGHIAVFPCDPSTVIDEQYTFLDLVFELSIVRLHVHLG